MSDVDVVDAEAVEVGTDVELRSPAPLNLFRATDPGEVIVKAAETAKPLAEVIRKQKLYKTIQGKNHVFVEGWTLLGSMLGVFPVVVWTRKLDNGWEARVEARTMAGATVGAAEAQCLRTEARWKSADDYAIRSMAQTRATSRAMRGPLGFVIQLAGFQPEPAEDMPGGDEPPAKKARATTSRAPAPAGEPSGSDRRAGDAGPVRSAPTVDGPSAAAEASASPATDSGAGQRSETDSSDASVGDDGTTAAPESPFKPPAGPRGGKNAALEAAELATELIALCKKLGARDSIPMVEERRDAGDTAWLKRQIATAAKAVARQEEGS